MAGEYLDPSNWPAWMDTLSGGPMQQFQGWPADINTPRPRRIQEQRRGAWPADETNPYMLETAMAHPAVAAGMGAAVQGLTKFPKVGAGLLSAYYGLSGTDPANGQEADPVKQLQTGLRDAGYYSGPIDGKMGPATSRAQQAKQQADQLAVQQQGAEAARATADAQRQAAAAQLAETQRQSEAAAAEQQKQAAGQERYQQAEGNVGPVSSALRSYGSPIGTTLGILGGPMARWGVTKASNALSRGAASEAEALMQTVPKGTPQRVANVNEFYRRGGAGAEVPFLNAPGQAPGFAANPSAAGMDKLFQPNAMKNHLTDAGVIGGFGAEAGSMKYMSGIASEDLQRAQESAQKDPSQMNIDRLQQAKDKVAFYDAMMNVGRAGAISYPVSMLKMQRSSSVPNMAGAEAERLKLEALLRKKQPLGLGAPGPAASQNMPIGIPPSMTGPAAWLGRQVR